MPAIRIIAIGIMVMMLSGCGQLVSERLAITNSATEPDCPITKKLVVLPFADYSYSVDAITAIQRNLIIMVNLTDQLISRGYQLPVQEDLLQYLADENIIRVKNSSQPLLAKEIEGSFYSPVMKEELAAIMDAESTYSGSFEGTTALDQKTLSKIAADFNAGYVMRGRIIGFGLGEDNTWNPLKKGVLPVVIGGSSRAVLGVAQSESYDTLYNMATGAALGAIANSNIDTLSDNASVSSSQAAMAGAGAGLLTSNSRGNEARIKLRLWVQSPENGQVIWTNRVEVKVKPQTVFADTSVEGLFTIAIEKAVSALINDFAAKI